MKRSAIKSALQFLLLFLLVSFFGVLYSQTVLSLPLFGDATIHGANARDVLTIGWTGLTAEYPAFYSYLMAMFFTFFGETGFNLVPFIGFLFLLVSTYLFITQITKNYFLGLVSVILVGASPKLIFYTARMYQEILISAFFIFCIYLLFKYLEEKKRIIFYFFVFIVSTILTMKQQGLFILYPTIVLFFMIDFFRKRTSLLDLGIIIFLPLIIGYGFYGTLFHTTGKLQPGSGEFQMINTINTVGQKIFFHHDAQEKVTQLTNTLDVIDKKYQDIAFKRAETRHIWPTDVFTNFDKFNQANNLYVPFQGIQGNLLVIFFLCFSLIGGFIYACFHYKKYSSLLLFSLIFLPINYILFARNSDQQRYHLFLPVFLLIFILIFVQVIFRRLQLSAPMQLVLVSALFLLLFLPMIVPRILINTRWSNSQLYSPSVGGIASIREAGEWMQHHSDKKTIIGQQCNNETHYYFQRPVIGDWRIYFLEKDDLKTYFTMHNISYYVVYTSQIVDDDKWEIICWIPKSFHTRLEELYKHAYITKKEDVIIYQIK